MILNHKAFKGASGQEAMLHSYILDKSPEISIDKRPLILICPGGGYSMTSDREGETVAMQFLAMGYHAAILRYSVAPAVFPEALVQVAASVLYLKDHADEWNIDVDKFIVSGFSAGGHLAASFGCFWQEKWLAEKLLGDQEYGKVAVVLSSKNVEDITKALKPAGMLLSYPVITSGEFAHHESIQCLLGDAYEADKEKMALEKAVSANFPKSFIWHTYEDGCVPVQNSLLLVDALVKNQVPTEFHMFAKGGHGLSLANRLTQIGDYGVETVCQSWLPMFHTWMESQFVEAD